MRYRVNRPDRGSKELIAYAESLGFLYEHLGGSIDGALAWGQHAVLVEWKSKGGTLTPTQQRLVARGFPIRFIQQPAQLDALKSELIGKVA